MQAKAMRKKAKKKDIRVIDAVAENLPYADKSKNTVLRLRRYVL